ncbi:MAG: hypothetical protein HFJ17_03910 [Clostridia bacterium]|nr:hypothetical protein [Clostridia bacterium]
MIDIPEEKLIEYLEDYADKKISLAYLKDILETDYRTIQNKIIGLSITHPDLYYKIIVNNPYRAKERTDIDFEALMIYIMKNRLTTIKATKIFNISRKTIQRRVNKIKSSNPDLVDLYKKYTNSNRFGINISKKMCEEIDNLEEKPVIIGKINEDREKYLLEVEENFNNLVLGGMSKDEAAKKIGLNSSAQVYKILNELYRLKIEDDVRENANKYKESLAVDVNNISEIEVKAEDVKIEGEKNDGR